MKIKFSNANLFDAEVNLKIDMTIEEISDEFKTVFGLSLIYNKNNARNKYRHNSVRSQKLKAYEKVGDVEEKIRDFTGFEVHITSMNEHYKLDTELRLAEATRMYNSKKI